MSMYSKQAIPDTAIPRIAHIARSTRSDDVPREWFRACRIAGKVAAEIARQSELRAVRMHARKSSPKLADQMIDRMQSRWSKIVDALVPLSSGAGTHEGSARIERGRSTPATSYDTYRGDAPCKSYGYGTACSTATVLLPVGWEIAEEDGATVARRARWAAHTSEQRQERYIIRQRGAYGLAATRGWLISGYHIEIADRAKAAKQAAKMAKARRDAQRENSIEMRIYGEEIMSISDSLAAGNCLSGSEGWARKWFPGRTEATIKEIVQAARKMGEPRAELAAKCAMRRAGRELAELALMSAVA